MKIGVHSVMVMRSLEDSLVVAKKLGFASFEIGCEWPHAYVTSLDVSWKKRFKEAGLAVFLHAPIADIAMLSSNPGIRRASLREIKKVVLKAKFLGAECVTVHSDVPNPFLYEEGVLWKVFVNQTRSLVRFAEKLGVRVAYENVPGTLLETGEDFLSVFEVFDSKYFGLTFDVAHAVLSGATDSFFRLGKEFGEKFFNVHVNDTKGFFDDHFPLGQGKIRWPSLFKKLRTFYNGFVHVEIFDDVAGAKKSKELIERLLKKKN